MPNLMSKRIDDDDYELPLMEQSCYRCIECRREFRSLKALHGHMRVHPAKGYRGVKKPPAKKARIDIDEFYAAAEILTILRRDAEKELAMALASTSGPVEAVPPAKTTYPCTTCNKSFDTHQALGGHVASHNKHRRVGAGEAGTERARGGVDAAKPPAVHRCDECGAVFASGVALGGHKSKHFHERRNAAAPAASAAAVPRPFVIDLNVAPAEEDEGAN